MTGPEHEHRPGRGLQRGTGRRGTGRRPGLSAVAARLDAATPAGRDRTIDALRAAAIFGVVMGHWLVTALVAGPGGTLRTAGPLRYLPELTPLSWVFQTLAVFFLVGGFTAARGLDSARRSGRSYRAWLRARLARLFGPVPVLILAWVPLGYGLWAAGSDPPTMLALGKLVVSPLWFLVVYALVTALTPVAAWLRDRLGGWTALVPLTAAGLVDLIRFGQGGLEWLGWLNVIFGWLVPFCLGVAWAGGAFASRRAAGALLAAGTAGTVALVLWFGYPASMVGVPGARVSNLNPPTLAAAAFGTAQAGLALLLRGPLARWTRRPVAWAIVVAANMSAMTVFLWHQTALLGVTALTLPAGPLPGLHTSPQTPAWPLWRLAWLPVFAMALAALWAVFRRWERTSATRPERQPR